MKKALLIIGLLGMLSCTTNGDEGEKAYTKSYVTEYYSSSGIEALWKSEGYILLQVVPNGKTYGVLSVNDADKAKYEAICILHGDYTYNRYFYYGPMHRSNQFQDKDFTSIEIASDQDYDETHPAGTLLNDLFLFASSSPAKYIARGYDSANEWWTNSSQYPKYIVYYLKHAKLTYGCEPVYDVVANLKATDLVLLGGVQGIIHQPALAALTPVTEPTLDRTHDITITLTDTNGNELTAQVMITF